MIFTYIFIVLIGSKNILRCNRDHIKAVPLLNGCASWYNGCFSIAGRHCQWTIFQVPMMILPMMMTSELAAFTISVTFWHFTLLYLGAKARTEASKYNSFSYFNLINHDLKLTVRKIMLQLLLCFMTFVLNTKTTFCPITANKVIGACFEPFTVNCGDSF